MMEHYDVIGDVHGYAQLLEDLLYKMGYTNTADGWAHPQRQAIFVGDLIDRGPENFRTVQIVRKMTDSGAAKMVMGNHEYNAICFHTPHPKGGYLRARSEKNIKQHQKVLEEIKIKGSAGEEEWRDHLEWFRKLPLFLELKGIRIVHACWDPDSVNYIIQNTIRDKEGRLTDSFLKQSAQIHTTAHEAVEVLLKGLEVKLPATHPGIYDKDNNRREWMRFRWWVSRNTWKNPLTYDQIVRGEWEALQKLAKIKVPNHILEGIIARRECPNSKPVFFGHYWFTGEPSLLTETTASLDYSVAMGGVLACYRWDGEKKLNSAKFVY